MGRIWLARVAGIMVLVALPAFGFSYATLTFSGKGMDIVSAGNNDRNGDTHSGCHEGSKGRGAGGNDKSATDGNQGQAQTCDGGITII